MKMKIGLGNLKFFDLAWLSLSESL